MNFFTARRYASVVLAMGLYLCVCLSQVGAVLKKLSGLSWFLAWRLPFTQPTLRCKEIQESPKIRVQYFPLELCPKLFRHRIETRRQSSLLTTSTTVDASWLDAHVGRQ